MCTIFGGRAPSTSRNILFLAIIRIGLVAGAAVIPGMTKFLEPTGGSVWLVEGYFTFAMLLAMAPSGVLADRLGEKRALQIGGFLLVAGAIVYLCSNTLSAFCLAEICLGLGKGFVLGTDETLLHSSLREKGETHMFGRYWARTVSCEVSACAVNFWLGGIFSQWHPKAPFAYALVWYLALLFLSCKLTIRARGESSHRKPKNVRRAVFRSCLWSNSSIIKAIAWYALISAALRIGTWSVAGYLEETKACISAGTLLALQCGISFGFTCYGNRLASILSATFMERFLALTLSVSFIALGSLVGPLAFLLLLIHPVVRGLSQVIYVKVLHEIVDHLAPEHRATIASVREMGFLITYLLFLNAARVGTSYWSTSSTLLWFGVGISVLALGLLFYPNKSTN